LSSLIARWISHRGEERHGAPPELAPSGRGVILRRPGEETT
jgi:hypothetical protein